MRNIKTCLLIVLLLSPLAASSADLTVSIEGTAEYDDNALRRNGQEEDDVLFRLKPKARIHEDRGQDFRYSLEYAVPFEFAVENGDELDDIDHEADGRVTYHVNDRIDLFVKDRFRYLRSALRNVQLDDVIGGEGDQLVNQERDRTTLNTASAGASFLVTPRLTSNLNVEHQYFDSERKDRAENWLLSGVADVNYLVTPKHTLGIGFQYIHQQFEDRDVIPGSTVNSYRGFASWVYRVTDTLSFSINAGPSLIDSDQDDPKASTSAPAIPFLSVPGGTNVTGLGLLNEDGTTATGTANPGSIVVSQLSNCPQIQSTAVQVFAGDVCPISGAVNGAPPPSGAGVFLDGFDDAGIIASATAQNALVDPAARGESDTRLDVFGEAVIAQHWTENLHTALRYKRTQAGASGLGGAVIGDSVSLSNTWDFAERWQLAMRGDWSLRQSVISNGVSQYLQAGDPMIAGFSGGVAPAGAVGLVTIQGGNTNKIDTMRYGVAGRLTHRFTRNTSAWVQLTYNEQTSQSRTLGDPSDFENLLAAVGVRHVFDPIKLW